MHYRVDLWRTLLNVDVLLDCPFENGIAKTFIEEQQFREVEGLNIFVIRRFLPEEDTGMLLTQKCGEDGQLRGMLRRSAFHN